MNRNIRNRLRFLLIIMTIIFSFICLYLVYFELFEAPKLSKHPNNIRNIADESKIHRGTIYDRNKVVIAQSIENEDGSEYREKQAPFSYAHSVGYVSRDHGKYAIENSYNRELLNLDDENVINMVRKALVDKQKGNDLVLTLDDNLQTLANELMSEEKGSIVIMNAKTGEVLTMISAPSFDSNNVDGIWDNLIEENDSVLFNRITQAQYTPGSIFKVIVDCAIRESNIDQNYEDTGQETYVDYDVFNYDNAVYGSIDLRDALTYSSNTYFSRKGVELGVSKLKDILSRFYFDKQIPFDLDVATSKTYLDEGMGEAELASVSFGQGKTLVTPLHMAMVAASIGNESVMVQPMLVKKILTPSGNVKSESQIKTLSEVTTREIARQVKEDMIYSFQNNGYFYPSFDVEIGAKTGTAENASGNDHAWSIGFLQKDEKLYSFAIVVEEAGDSGGMIAMPKVYTLVEKMNELGYFN